MHKWFVRAKRLRVVVAALAVAIPTSARAELVPKGVVLSRRVVVLSSSVGAQPERLAMTARDVVERAIAESSPAGATLVSPEKVDAIGRRFERGRPDDPREADWASLDAALKAYDNADLKESRAKLTAALPGLFARPYVTRGDERLTSLRRRAALCLALVHLANGEALAASAVLRQLIQIDPHYEPRPGEYPARFIALVARLRSEMLTSVMRVSVEAVSAAGRYLVNGMPVAIQPGGGQQILLPAGIAWFQWQLGKLRGPLVRVEGKTEEVVPVRPDPARERRIEAIGNRLHLVAPWRGDDEVGEKELALTVASEAGADGALIVRADGTVRWVSAKHEARGRLEFPARVDQASREIARLFAPPVEVTSRGVAGLKTKTRFRLWKWITAGAGLATSAVGLTFGLLAQSKQREYDETPQTPSNVARLRELESTGETQSKIATGAFIAGGVILAGAALLFALDKPVAVVIDTPRTSQLPLSRFALGLRWSLR